ncbi:MAG TPA: glycosyltransferase [Tepidisphaeraceae bacterium]|jgi:glycosyltransferase involved in cell wall biosynthesis|nr:glycosyltransferase [Tepidisphaeraceae bacterium]
MRVFMLGWEFPPFISGGLGTACYGLTKAMSALGTDILFVLPRPVSTPFSSHLTLVSPSPEAVATASAGGRSSSSPGVGTSPVVTEFRMDEFEHVTFRTVDAQMVDPYTRPEDYDVQIKTIREERTRITDATPIDPILTPPVGARAVAAVASSHPAPSASAPQQNREPGLKVDGPIKSFLGNGSPGAHYAGDLFSEIQRYAMLATDIARTEHANVVHAHDWMTFPAGMAVAAQKGLPLVVHVHSTEFDRSGVHVDTRIYDIERRGMHAAMKVIAVSHLTKNIIVQQYGIDPSKVEVVYNAIESNGALSDFDEEKYKIHKDEKVVLFLGRITMQKGPEYFIAAAKKVLEVMDNVKFVMAGSGDMIRRTIEMAAAMGIGHKVLFTGFLRGGDVDKVFKMADLYVMPSVSEPFGIAPLEAMSNDVPVIISKQSGVSEVLTHALKVDFWDVNEMANKIIAVLRHPPLASTLRQHGSFEVKAMSWTDAAKGCVDVYEMATGGMTARV